MAIFSRRILQAILDENGKTLALRQCQEHLDRLNGKDADQRLSVEWEIAVLYGAGKLVHVEFEPPMPTGKKPDMRLTLADQEVLAEITCVSDKGLNEANPTDYLCSELFRRLRRLQLSPNRFRIQVGGNYTELWLGGDAKATLKLPHRSKFASDIFGEQFRDFIKSIQKFPEQATSMAISTPGIDVKFEYNPGQEFFGSTHLSYTVCHLLENNPLFNRLKRKAEQLQQANYKGTVGVIVCDGGCALLSDAGRRGMNYGCSNVVKHFFRCYPKIGFVQVITIKGDQWTTSRPKRYEVVSAQYLNTADNRLLLNELARINEKLPNPETTPFAAHHQHYRHCGRSFVGGWEFNGHMKISVRMLQELLAGRITSAEFLEAHGDFRLGNGPNIFELRLRSGQLINDAKIVSGDAKDDDWIDFAFGESDPAISPFSNPRFTDNLS